MRKKVRKSLAFLLALALVVSVMSGLGLSVSADDAQNEPVVTETEGEPAEEKLKAEESTPKEGEKEEEADPDAEAVPEEKKDEQKAEGEGSGEKAAEKQEKATPKAGENVQTATIGTGDKTVTVKTTAAAGVLPEGAKLVVKKLANQDQAYQDAESTLKDSQVTYDDFLALDVGFEVNGKEVEPEAGSVQVQFELGAGLLPETADTSTLAVQHLTDGKAETVADAGAVTAGDVTVKNEAVKADFAVKSFSTFTITWTDHYTLTVHYVDESGQELAGINENVVIESNSKITFATQYANAVSGYKFVKAYYYKNGYSNENNKKEITDIVTSTTTSTGLFGVTYNTYWLEFKNGDTSIEKLSETAKRNVYLVYTKDESGGESGGTTILPKPSQSKTATRNDDGTYDLKLSISGDVGTVKEKAKIDVLLIVDKSGSMDKGFGSSENWQKKITAVGTATKELTTALSANDKLDVRYSVVSFSGDINDDYVIQESAWLRQGWTSSASATNFAVSSISPDGGTNYQAGIREGIKQLKQVRKDAQTVVIFLTDGKPTFRLTAIDEPYNRWGAYDINGYYNYRYGRGNEDPASNNINAAVEEIKRMSASYFFCVGAGLEEDGRANLESLCTAANAANISHDVAKAKEAVFLCDSVEDLNKTFENFGEIVSNLNCTEVNVTDTLSDKAQVVKTDGKLSDLTVTVTTGEATYTGVGSVTIPKTKENKETTITAKYENDGKSIVLMFPLEYKLEKGYEYSVTTKIEPTEAAYQEYRKGNENYPEMPDVNTGTHAENNEKGFKCNTQATLSYHDGQGNKTSDFKHPVIRLTPGKLVIEKTIAGELTEAQVKELENALTFKYKLNKGTEQSAKLTNWTKNADDTYTASATVASGLSPNTEYTVTEANKNVEGYVVDTTTSSATGTISKGETKTASFTNTYTKATQDLTITKRIEKNATFTFKTKYTFTVTADKIADVAGKSYTTDKNTSVSFNDSGVATVTIQDAGSIVIKDLPVGDYTVTEQPPEDVTGYDFKEATYSPANGEITLNSSAPGQVTVTNKYEIKKVDVTVKKVLDGNMYDSTDTFDFTVNDKKQDATLGHNQEKTYTVDYGSTFTVTEEANSKGYELTKVESDKNIGSKINNGYKIDSVTENTTITFTNTKTIQPPNGIITTIAPYAIMVVLAAGAGVYFVYSRRRRNH